MKKIIYGEFQNKKTNELVRNPSIEIRTFERSFFKLTRDTLAKILWDFGNINHKILAVLIQNLQHKSNHVLFGKEELLAFFDEKFGINRYRTIKALELLEKLQLIKFVSEHEIAINPMYLNSRQGELYSHDFSRFKLDMLESYYKRKKQIIPVNNIKIINTLIKEKNNYTEYTDKNFIKVKYEFFEIINSLGSKKIKAFTYLFENLKTNDISIIVERKKAGVNKETLNKVTQWLCQKNILYLQKPGVYLINNEYISTKFGYARIQNIKYYCEQKTNK